MIALAPAAEDVWRAQPKQREFLLRTEYQVLYGGSAGGGKTDALLINHVLTCERYPGAKTLYLRRTFADLNKPGSAIPRSRELLHGRAHWNDQQHKWTFGNGSILQFGHLQTAADVYDYQGAQVDLLSFDELTQFQEEQFDFLATRVRATVPGVKPTIRAATNPGGVGHGFVRRRFVDAGPWGEPFPLRDRETGEVLIDPVTGEPQLGIFIPAKVADNPALLQRDPGYAARLSGLPEALRRAYLEGDWDLFQGQVFSAFRRDLHVCRPFSIPPEWPRWRAVDYGFHAPFCCLWFARSPDHVVYVYRELYATGMSDAEQARHIHGASAGERIWTTYGDPSMWSTQPNGTTIAQVYASNGVQMVKANNDRLAGLQRVHQALTEEPVLQIFEGCVNLIRTLPALVYDQHNVEDVDTDGEDHSYDSLRYGLAAMQRLLQTTGGVTRYGLGR